MSLRGMDFSWARPPIDQVDVVFRYIGDSGACLSAGEAAAIHAAGKAIAPNLERAADAPKHGAAQALADGTYANDHLDRLGCPNNVIVWYSCDTSANYADVAPYYQALHAQGRRPVGMYGPLHPGVQLRNEGTINGVWCANAASWSGYSSWSAMVADARAQADVVQYLSHPLAGVDPNAYDYDEVCRPFAWWGTTPNPNPNPNPAGDEDMPNMIIPRKVTSTVAGAYPCIHFDKVEKRFIGYNGVTFVQNNNFSVSSGFGVCVAQLTATSSASLEMCEAPDGNGVILLDLSNGHNFGVAYQDLGPDPYERAAPAAPASAPAVDVGTLAVQVASHLTIATK